MVYSIFELEHDMCREIRESAGFVSQDRPTREAPLRGIVRAALGVAAFAVLVPLCF
ncbi:hypothetical protein [Pseudodesulfovibrio senegalensis]|uniref:hypothetical protein n=1 Tax=Pseudodesulfovibrio senegalensis TaxID=1721087 RepID=UPI001375C9D4|nr:hypothetical protein [Pseudodesulfovibrio senegalensis]